MTSGTSSLVDGSAPHRPRMRRPCRRRARRSPRSASLLGRLVRFSASPSSRVSPSPSGLAASASPSRPRPAPPWPSRRGPGGLKYLLVVVGFSSKSEVWQAGQRPGAAAPFSRPWQRKQAVIDMKSVCFLLGSPVSVVEREFEVLVVGDAVMTHRARDVDLGVHLVVDLDARCLASRCGSACCDTACTAWSPW